MGRTALWTVAWLIIYIVIHTSCVCVYDVMIQISNAMYGDLRWIWISSGTHARNMSILGDDRSLAASIQQQPIYFCGIDV